MPLSPRELRELKRREKMRANPAPVELIPLDRELSFLNWTVLGTPVKSFIAILGVSALVSWLVAKGKAGSR